MAFMIFPLQYDNDIEIEGGEQEIADSYEHLDQNLEYVLENVLQENEVYSEEYKELRYNYNSLLMNICQCSEYDTCCEYGCIHGGNYINMGSELVLRADRKSDLIYECSLMCKCSYKNCRNRLLQKGPRRNLLIIDSPRYGSKGLATSRDIPCGGFICEYAGELLTISETKRRIRDNQCHSKMNYVLCLNEIPQCKLAKPQTSRDTIAVIVDPSRRGNVGRYINHSCQPNCQIYSVRVDCPLPRIGIFAKRRILAGEELTFNYVDNMANFETNEINCYQFPAKPCLCKSSNCKNFLPNVEFL